MNAHNSSRNAQSCRVFDSPSNQSSHQKRWDDDSDGPLFYLKLESENSSRIIPKYKMIMIGND